MANVLQLAPPAISRDTVEMLAQALEDARSGDVVGAVLLLRTPGNDFTIDFAGLAKDDPIFTRGMLAKLDDELALLPYRPA